MQSVIITGGAGFIGLHLFEKLARRGWQVIILDDLSLGKIGNIRPLLKEERVEFWNSISQLKREASISDSTSWNIP